MRLMVKEGFEYKGYIEAKRRKLRILVDELKEAPLVESQQQL